MDNNHPGYSYNLGCSGEHLRALRADLFHKLGLIVVAEQHLPAVITDGLYDKTLDKYRQVINQVIGDNNGNL